MKESIFEEEGILAMSIRRKIADSLNAKYFYRHIVCCIVLIKQALVFTFLIDAVYLVLIVKLIAKVVDNVLDHHYLQLDLLPNQVDNVFEGSLFIVTGFEFFMF